MSMPSHTICQMGSSCQHTAEAQSTTKPLCVAPRPSNHKPLIKSWPDQFQPVPELPGLQTGWQWQNTRTNRGWVFSSGPALHPCSSPTTQCLQGPWHSHPTVLAAPQAATAQHNRAQHKLDSGDSNRVVARAITMFQTPNPLDNMLGLALLNREQRCDLGKAACQSTDNKRLPFDDATTSRSSRMLHTGAQQQHSS